MAYTLEQINEAIKKADAANDGDAVRALAAARAQILLAQEQEPPEPQKPEPSVWQQAMRLQNDPMAQVSLQGGLSTEDVAKATVQTSRDMAAGSSRLLTGPGALVTAGAEKLGVPGASVEQYNRGVQQLERDISGGDPDPMVAGTAEFLAGVGVPISAAKKAKTLWEAIKGGAKTGAVTGAALGNDPTATTPGEVGQSALTRAALGTLLGGTVAAIPGAKPAMMNFIKKLADTGRPVKETLDLLIEKGKSAFFKDMPLTVGQQTGSPTLIALQQKVAGKRAFDFQNQQLEDFGKAADAIEAAVQGSKSPQVAAEKLSAAVGRATGRLQSAASNEYEQGLAAVRSIAARDPNQFQIPFDNFEAALVKAQEGIGGTGPRSKWYEWINPETVRADPKLQEALGVIEQARAAGQNGFNVDTIINIKRAANYLRRGLNKGPNMTAAEKEQNRLGKAIAKGIDADIDNFLNPEAGLIPAGVSNDTRDALRMLSEVNARYGERVAQINSHKASFVVRAFGKVPQSPEDAFEALIRKDPDQQIRALNIIRGSAPEILDDIKAWKLSQVTRNMRSQVASGNISTVDPATFIDELTNGSEIVASRMWTPKELQDIKSGIATARLLLTDMPTGKTVSARGVDDPGRVGAAAVTRSPAFVTVHLYQLFGRGNVEKMLFSPKGIEAFNVLRDTYTKPTAKTVQALQVLTNLALVPERGEDSTEFEEE